MAEEKNELEKNIEFLEWLRKHYTLCLLMGDSYTPCDGAITKYIVARYLEEKEL